MKAKAYLIYWLTGWKNIKVFGNPNYVTDYIILLKNRSIYRAIYSTRYEKWIIPGIGEVVPINPVIYWRNLPKVFWFLK